MLFLAADLLVVATAVRLAVVAPLRGGLDRVLAGAVLAASQVAVSVLIAGGLLRSMTAGALLAVNAVLALAAYAATLRMPSRVRLGALRSRVSRLTAAAREHPWTALLVATAVVALLWRIVVAYALPPYGYDSLGYHLPTVAGWLQAGHIGTHHVHVYSASFPSNVELLFAWVAVFLHSDVWIGAAQVPLAVVGGLAVAGLSRLARVQWWASVAAGALFVLSPIVLTQASSNYVDLSVGALFLTGVYLILRAFPAGAWDAPVDGEASSTGAGAWSPVCLVLAGCAIGLAVGAKPVGPLLGLVALLCLAAGALVTRRRLGPGSARPVAHGLLLLAPMLCLASFWYIRDLVEFSNPIYPGNVSILGLSVFHGPGVTLSRLPSGSGLSAIAHSWGYDFTRIFNHSSGRWDRADEYEGGLGLVWLLLGLPLLIPFTIAAWRRNRMLVWSFLVPLAVLFAVQPYRWWNRFTIFLLAPGLAALAYFVGRSGSRRLRLGLQSLTLVCVGVSLWFSSTHFVGWGHVYGAGRVVALVGKPAQQRTIGRLFLPELRWVDHVEHDARIAVSLRPDIARDRFPPFYGLWGRHFAHHVFALPRLSRTATLRWLRARSIDYAYVRRGTPPDTWLRGQPGVRVVFSDRQVAAYALPGARRARAAPAAS